MCIELTFPISRVLQTFCHIYPLLFSTFKFPIGYYYLSKAFTWMLYLLDCIENCGADIISELRTAVQPPKTKAFPTKIQFSEGLQKNNSIRKFNSPFRMSYEDLYETGI